jgi:hypothetical protein
MTGANAIVLIAAASAHNTWRANPRVEKIRLSNGLGGNPQRHDTPDSSHHAPAKLSHIETAERDANRESNRLVSTFVTQVLGQAFPDMTVDTRSALRAYGRAPRALLFDGQS